MKTADIVYLERFGEREKWSIFASVINNDKTMYQTKNN